MTDAVDALAKLRLPFPPHQISKLPKETRAQIDARKADKNLMVWKCPICGGPHHKNATHLDYVGHAAATDRLLDADPRWTWDPVPDAAALGLPTVPGGMWIKLTVDGVSRYGFGSADGKSGGDAIKEVIGDAIRNAGMRFGMALDLWHKGDLHADEEEAAAAPRHDPPPSRDRQADTTPMLTEEQRDMMMTMLEKTGSDVRAFCQHFGIKSVPELPASRFDEAFGMLDRKAKKAVAAKRAPAAQHDDILEDEVPY